MNQLPRPSAFRSHLLWTLLDPEMHYESHTGSLWVMMLVDEATVQKWLLYLNHGLSTWPCTHDF